MPWFRLDDRFHSHPKVITAGNEAVGLYVRCGSYAAEHLTDGFIAEQVALQYGTPELAETLVRTKLWRRVRGGWQMPDYLEYNPSRQQVVDKSKARAEAGRKGGLASGTVRSKPEANASRLVDHGANPDPGPNPGVEVHLRNQSSDRNGRASPAVIDAIMSEVFDVTGRHVTEEWADRIAVMLLDGRSTASPAAYCRQAIRNEPNPRLRFLPLY